MARIIKALLMLIALLEFSIFSFQFSKAYAASSCQPIYGGGQTCTIAPIPTYAVMKKTGFPIMPPPTISKTPSTGPEALALFSLIPTGIAGWFLRKKSRRLRL